ncbi:uncharacterized protein LOC122614803 isoform X1 [Drosophila teissieri]|uniref:uncharacterized protein LOC122614803 isoform X1 n=1 Tax=Drosophila teissieri TaxID=7243 RepID=UPI001CB9F738|nr:uncharacterized protein LOC122614803 isoform X1 [Drosophila teissieri]
MESTKTTKETSTETTSEGLIPDDTTQIWVFDGKDPDAPIPTKDPSISNLRISQASIALGQSKYDTKKKKKGTTKELERTTKTRNYCTEFLPTWSSKEDQGLRRVRWLFMKGPYPYTGSAWSSRRSYLKI